MIHSTSSEVKTVLSGISKHRNRLTPISQGVHSGVNCFLVLLWHLIKHASTCFTAPHRRLKLRYQVFPAHKQACTNLTVLPKWSKRLSRSSMALKQASTCFTAPPRRGKRRYQAFNAYKQACANLKGSPH